MVELIEKHQLLGGAIPTIIATIIPLIVAFIAYRFKTSKNVSSPTPEVNINKVGRDAYINNKNVTVNNK